MCVCGDRCFQDYGIQILSCSSALARVSVYICVSAYCCICVPACCYKSCDVPRLFHGRVSHTSSYYTTMCVSLMMLPYVCPHATTNLVMFSFFALGCSDGQTRQLSNDLRGLLSLYIYISSSSFSQSRSLSSSSTSIVPVEIWRTICYRNAREAAPPNPGFPLQNRYLCLCLVSAAVSAGAVHLVCVCVGAACV